jgi:hypothetical protein
MIVTVSAKRKQKRIYLRQEIDLIVVWRISWLAEGRLYYDYRHFYFIYFFCDMKLKYKKKVERESIYTSLVVTIDVQLP